MGEAKTQCPFQRRCFCDKLMSCVCCRYKVEYCSDPFLYPVWVHNLFINQIWYSCHLFCFLHQLSHCEPRFHFRVTASGPMKLQLSETLNVGVGGLPDSAFYTTVISHFFLFVLFCWCWFFFFFFYFDLVLKPDHASQSQEHISVKIVISPFYVQLCEWHFSRSWLDFWIKKTE